MLATLDAPVATRMTGPHRHRSRRPRATPSIDVLRRLRLVDLVRLTGFSKPKLIADIRSGYLVADRQRDPVTGRVVGRLWIITFADAQRYLRSLGVLD